MSSLAGVVHDPTAPPDHGSLRWSLRYLGRQPWWPQFRRARRGVVSDVDDALWVGHFCAWLQDRHLDIEHCTRQDRDAYLAEIRSFRPGPRVACTGAVTALIDFLAAHPPGPERLYVT